MFRCSAIVFDAPAMVSNHMNIPSSQVTFSSTLLRNSRGGSCWKNGTGNSAEWGIVLIANGILRYLNLLLFFLVRSWWFHWTKSSSLWNDFVLLSTNHVDTNDIFSHVPFVQILRFLTHCFYTLWGVPGFSWTSSYTLKYTK